MLNTTKVEELSEELELILGSPDNLHKQLTAVEKLFYRLVRQLTNEEMFAFRNFYARFHYILNKLPLSADERKNIDAFRRFLKKADKGPLSGQSLEQAGEVLRRVMLSASGSRPAETAGYSDVYFTRLVPQRNYAALDDLKVLCDSWTAPEYKDGKAGFILEAYDLQEIQRKVRIHIRDDAYYRHTAVGELLVKSSILQLQHVSLLTTGENEYETTFDTLITLEPDYLVEATAVGECFNVDGFSSPVFLLSRLVEDLPGAPALKGSLIGYYLDEMIRAEVIDKDEIYRTAQKNNAMKAASLGLEQMQVIRSSIHNEHLPNIDWLVRKESQKSLWIEPTYFSTAYGLQGRIDLLSSDKKAATRDIIELKSGKPTTPGGLPAWLNHKMQVTCYDMMLEDTYGRDRTGVNAIFYSKCTLLPYRPIISEHREKQQVLGCRNQVVAHLFRLASGDFSALLKIKEEGIERLPPFSQLNLQKFQSFYQPGRITTEYYQELIAFLLRELINTKVGYLLKDDLEDHSNGFAGLWLDTLDEKEDDFRIIYDLEVSGEIDEDEGWITLSYTKKIDHSFRKGDLVILYPKTGDEYAPLRQHMLKGSLAEIHSDHLIVSLNNKQTAYDFIKEFHQWAIEPDIFERNTWSAISCLFNVLTSSDRKKRLLFGHERPVFQRGKTYYNAPMTVTQLDAIQGALDARDYFLVQGPPGTGKTSTFLVNYIEEEQRRHQHKIVVLAFTNKAVEKICESFRNNRNDRPIDYLRIGSRNVQDAALFSEQLKDDNPDNWRKIIDGHRVFVSTVATFQNNWQLLRSFFPFYEVIVDEASQLTEATLSGILGLFDKFILIGDHKQLPAVVSQDEKMCRTNNSYLRQLGITDLRLSLFERMMINSRRQGWKETYIQLQDHYRMHQDIASLISDNYESILWAGDKRQVSREPLYIVPENHILSPLAAHRAVFVESPAGSGFKKNRQEALVAATIANALIATGQLDPKEIGIITPFRAQIAAIRMCLSPELIDNEDLIIDTVERYQGDERKVIIFSTTICNARQLGMIQSVWKDDVAETDRKLLVSLSRASEQLIILGNSEALKAAPMYKEIIGRIEEKGGYDTSFAG